MKRLLMGVVTMLSWLHVIGLASPEDAAYHLVGDPEVYTLVNLHPREYRLYSVNYLQVELLSLCTKVRIESVDSRQMVFYHGETGRKYTYIFHNSLRVPIPKHLDRFFGKRCDKQKIETMSKVDQEGILQGRVLHGMTKEGVILAIGYPPEHATPSLESNAWRYWKSRFDTILVHFGDGKVIRIQD